MKGTNTIKITKRLLPMCEGDKTKALRRIVIKRDNDPINPREEWDNVFKVHSESRYLASDKDALNPVIDYGKSPDEAKFYDGVYALPIYAYVHSGMVLSLVPFADRWDSGCVGFMYVAKAEFCKEFGLKRFSTKRAMGVAQSEVYAMNQALTGEVYGFVEQTRETAESEWEDGDSCWGYFGEESIAEMVSDAGGYEKGTIICDDASTNKSEVVMTIAMIDNRKAA